MQLNKSNLFGDQKTEKTAKIHILSSVILQKYPLFKVSGILFFCKLRPAIANPTVSLVFSSQYFLPANFCQRITEQSNMDT